MITMVASDALTTREREIVSLTADGFTAREVGEMLDLSPQTVETHRKNVIRKMRARNVTHAVVLCMREGRVS